ncbi:AraC family transcriptional regulator [Maricurvus nonylphenolicus]|uniref:AraC family transcriptional regulator n=1 Tax=Maricurvus nonylphenolicus TaxID=1008307 RepID=UPI0036F3FCB6
MELRSTTLASWAGAIAESLRDHGLDPAAVFTEAGLDIKQTLDPDARFLVSDMTRLWKVCVKATNEPSFGLSVPAFRSATTFHAMGMAVDACGTLHESLKRLVKLSRLVSNVADMRLEQQANGDWSLIWSIEPDIRALIADEALDAFLHSFVSRLNEEDLAEVHFVRQLPEDLAPYRKAFYGRPMHFEAKDDRVVIHKEAMDKVRQTSNPALASAGESVALDYLQKLERDNVVLHVENEIRHRLQSGEPKQQDIADALHLSVRQLQRKLAANDTSFAQLLQEIRHQLAKEYLADSTRSIVDISLSLGFSDQSNFSAAFRRWEGVSPTEFRQ